MTVHLVGGTVVDMLTEVRLILLFNLFISLKAVAPLSYTVVFLALVVRGVLASKAVGITPKFAVDILANVGVNMWVVTVNA